MDSIDTIRTKLTRIHQEHVLASWDRLEPVERERLLGQLRGLDLDALPGLINDYVLNKPAVRVPATLEPVAFYPNDPDNPDRPWNPEAAQRTGENLVKAGRIAAFVVAGGQGSRLGFDGPKGCYPAGVLSNKSLFQIFAEGLLGAQDRHHCVIPWYIMTSPLNHEATTNFFEQHKCFGLRRDQIMFFQQGVMPSLDIKTGRLLSASPGVIATNPDGHGGSIRALHASGALADMRSRGVQHLSYFQVDNPLVRVIDPVFIGLHAAAADSSGEMSSKMVRKTDPAEKVGLFVRADGKTTVMEYSDMPHELQTQRDGEGLRFNAANIAVHILSVEFLERLATDVRFQLPYHRAEKKIPFYDHTSGREVSPAENNGVKLEKFIFDALPLCKNPIVYETLRAEEFAPLKNAAGVDSAESSRALQSARAAGWLERAGVRVPRKPDGSPDCVIEISPRTASSFEELRPRVPPGKSIAAGARVLL